MLDETVIERVGDGDASELKAEIYYKHAQEKIKIERRACQNLKHS